MCSHKNKSLKELRTIKPDNRQNIAVTFTPDIGLNKQYPLVNPSRARRQYTSCAMYLQSLDICTKCQSNCQLDDIFDAPVNTCKLSLFNSKKLADKKRLTMDLRDAAVLS